MGDANPSPNPQVVDKGSTFATQPSASKSGQSHRQATLIQQALDMA
jgi:hypothetical protein